MGQPLNSPPVYFTLVQARFNPLLNLAEYVRAIQDQMRKAGYPAYEVRTNIVMRVDMQDGKAIPQAVPNEQYLFGNLEQTHGFVLGADALTFESSNYGTYEAFSGEFFKGLSLVHEHVHLDFTERLGLRYLDHVMPKPGESLEAYLVPQVLGLGARLGGRVIHAFSETFSEVDQVRLRCRALVQDGPLAFPPDLVSQALQVQQRFLANQGVHATLDTDGFVEGREPFSLEKLAQQLDTIHEVIGDAFRATVTEHAMNVWSEPCLLS